MKSTRKACLGCWALMLLAGTGFAQSPQFDTYDGSVRIGGGSPQYGYDASGSAYGISPGAIQYDPYGNPTNGAAAYAQTQYEVPQNSYYDAQYQSGHIGYAPYSAQQYGQTYSTPAGATLDPAFRAAAGLGGPSYSELEAGRWAIYRENLDRYGTNGGMTTLHFLQPFRVFGEYNILAINPRASIDDFGNGLANVGLIHRIYSPDMDRVFGQSFWYDFDSSHLENYHRVGWQFETVGRYVSFRANANFVLNNDSTRIRRTFADTARFAGHSIVVDATDLFETPFNEFSAELAGPTPFLGRYGMEWGVGLYYLNGDMLDDSFGVSGRAQWQLTEDAWLQAYITNDDHFDTQFSLNLELSLPNGRPSRIMRPLPPVMALTQSVLRTYRTPAKLHRSQLTVAEIDPCDDQPLLIAHIDPDAAAGGDGSASNPFGSLADFNAAGGAANFDIIFVQAREDGTDTNLDTGITIFDGQRLLGNGQTRDGQLLTYTSARGTFALPGQDPLGVRPLISNSMAPGTAVVTLAGNQVEVNNFTIDATNTANGIVSAGAGIGGGIDGFVIRNNTFVNFFDAINITTDTTQTPAFACRIENHAFVDFNDFQGDFGSSSGVTIRHVAGTGADSLNLRIADNTLSGILGEDVDGDGTLDLLNEDINGNGILDPFEDFDGDGNLDIVEDANGNGLLDLGDAIIVTATNGTILANDTDNTDPSLVTGILRNTIDNSGSGITVISDGATTNVRVAANDNVVTNSTNPNIDPTPLLQQGNAFEFLVRNSATMTVESFRTTVDPLQPQGAFGGLGNGASFIATGLGSTLNIASVTDVSAIFGNEFSDNAGHGLQFVANDRAVINVTGVESNEANRNGQTGIRFAALNGGTANVSHVLSNVADSNLTNGFGVVADDGGTGIATTVIIQRGVTGTGFTGNEATNNAVDGINVRATGPDALIDFDLGSVAAGSEANIITGNGEIDVDGDGKLDLVAEDTNGNGTLDPGEDLDGDGVLDVAEIDRNGNGTLDLGDGIEFLAQGGARIQGSIRNNIISSNSNSGIHLITEGTDPTNAFGSQIDLNDVVQQWDIAFNQITNNGLGGQGTGFGILAESSGIRPLIGPNLDLWVYGLHPETGEGISNNLQPGFMLNSSEFTNFNVRIGDPVRNTIFDGNVDAGIALHLTDDADGDFNVVNALVTNTEDGPNGLFNGDGIAVILENTASLRGSVTRSQIGGFVDGALAANEGSGIRVVNSGNNFPLFTEIFSFDIGGPTVADRNIISENGDHGIQFVRTGAGRTGVTNPIRIRNNFINNNGLDGINIDSAGLFGPNPLTPWIDRFEVDDNIITNNDSDGVHLIVRADAQLNVDMDNNVINLNSANGIYTSEQRNTAADLRGLSGQWTRNEIFQNRQHGIKLDATHGTALATADNPNGRLLIGHLTDDGFGNDIIDNDHDGIFITGAGEIDISRNLIAENGQNTMAATRVDADGMVIDGDNDAGIDIDAFFGHNLLPVRVGIYGNDIIDNRGDGIENWSARGLVTLDIQQNFIAFNDGRGFDLLAAGYGGGLGSLTQATFNNNIVNENGQEGVYIVLTASETQRQYTINTSFDTPLVSDGSIDAATRLRFDMNNNQVLANGGITTNGITHGFDASGLVVRIGTTQSPLSPYDATGAPFIDDDEFVSDGVGINSAFNRGGAIMRVADNTFGGNFGDDILFHSFVSTAELTATWEGTSTWSDTEYSHSGRYFGDPLARLDLHWNNNTFEVGESNPNGGTDFIPGNLTSRRAFYNNSDGTFKSRLAVAATPPIFDGPFTSATRRRNAQRVAARIPNFMAPAGPGANAAQYMYPGLGPSTFRVRGDQAQILAAGFALDGDPYLTTFDSSGPVLPNTIFGELGYGWTYLGL